MKSPDRRNFVREVLERQKEKLYRKREVPERKW
jgi:hypothetical protein